jgi:putative oxidoreductase
MVPRLESLSAGRDAVLLLIRLVLGAFLIWGVQDNLLSAERMREFEAFLRLKGFPAPALAAPLSCWAQLACGVSFALGLLIRWGGLLCVVNFAVAILMVDAELGIRPSFPAASLLLFGLLFATHGAGRLSLDELLARRRAAG